MNRISRFHLSAFFLHRFLVTVFLLGALSRSWAGLGLPPVVLGAPESRNVVPGASVTFNVLLSVSLTPVTYQWRHNGTNILNATNQSFTKINVQPTDAGEYTVEITNGAGKATASAMLSVDSSPVRLTSTLLGNGFLNLHIEGPLVATYIVQSSTDLKTWTAISTNLVVLGLLDLPIGKPPQADGVTRFYRALVK